MPRQAVLKPSHAIYRLHGQVFSLGDRVIMVQDAAVGGVQLSMKGAVIGIKTDSLEVVWDSPFIGGETLGGRCSEHRGSSVPYSSCLNLTRKQFEVAVGSGPKAVNQKGQFQPKFGPRPVVPSKHFTPNQNYPVKPSFPPRGIPNKTPQTVAQTVSQKPSPAANRFAVFGSGNNATQGGKPQPGAQQTANHTQNLALLLNGGKPKSGAPVQPHLAPISRNSFQPLVRPAPDSVAPQPTVVPATQPQVFRPQTGFRGGRGGGPGRGRGRGRGGAVMNGTHVNNHSEASTSKPAGSKGPKSDAVARGEQGATRGTNKAKKTKPAKTDGKPSADKPASTSAQ